MTLHSTIRLSDLETLEDHLEAFISIESDRQNYYGDWFSGYETPIKEAAKRKMDAICNRIDKRFPDN